MEIVESLLPAPSVERTRIDCPVVRVTLLEDRARVFRSGSVKLSPGTNRVLIFGVAPVLQDVSLCAKSSSGRVADARARRAMRVLAKHKEAEIAALENDIEVQAEALMWLEEDVSRIARRRERVMSAIAESASEIPEDAAWGMISRETWAASFESMMKRSRKLTQDALERIVRHRRGRESVERLHERLEAMSRVDSTFVAWLEVDIETTEATTASLEVDYVVPNALWRPAHRATLGEKKLAIASSAVVWQNTGEDWKDVDLSFSTSRSSLGIDPPLLSDDHLNAKKKSEQLVVQAREVEVQKLPSAGGGTPTRAVELPGVDDGGEVRSLHAPSKSTVLTNGRPMFVALGSVELDARQELIALPEAESAAVVRVAARLDGRSPLLAGPVELFRDHGQVGQSMLPFVPPGGPLELGFGPDEDIRIQRRTKTAKEVDPVDNWKVHVTVVTIFSSNLGPHPKTVEMTERVPVSEIAEVEVSILEDRSTAGFSTDAHGFVRWTVEIPAYGTQKLALTYSVSTAPSVQTSL